MPMLTRTINRVRTTRLPHVYVLLVLLAFGLMVFFSYIYFSGTERKHLRTETYNILVIAQSRIESGLNEHKVAMDGLSRSVRHVILKGGSAGELQEYLKEEGAHLFGD